MAHRSMRDPDADGWERSDMPIVCETCLGPNPFVRMQRIEFGGTCHISERPYTVFRWRPGNEARYKKTVICQEVAKAKNVCQVCLLDLDYSLPVQVRDYALGLDNEDEPSSAVGKEFQLQRKVDEGSLDSSFAQQRPNDLLLRLQRNSPYYKRNEAKVCSFFVKGTCNRGAECPYRHEMPLGGDLANQNMKDRYYGVNDPVANKMMKRVSDMPKLEPPADTSIMTLYVGGLQPDVVEADIRDEFYSFGEIASVRIVPNKMCAFVTFTTRSAAEKAAEEKQHTLVLKGQRSRLMWGRPQQPREGGAAAGHASGSMAPPAEVQAAMGLAAGAAAGSGLPYASMDPQAMGTRIPAAGDAGKRGGSDEQDDNADASSKRVRTEMGTGYGAQGSAVAGGPRPPMPPVSYGMGPPPPQQPMMMMPPPSQFGVMPPPGYPGIMANRGTVPPPRPPSSVPPPQPPPSVSS